MADNTNPQAIFVVNNHIRPAADKFAQLYNRCKALAAEASAENWAALFPNNADIIIDGAASDGRAIITNADVNVFITIITGYITFMEQNSNANRNNVFKIATNTGGI